MTFTIWYVLIGVILITMALSTSVLQRLPLTTSLLYLAVGVILGPNGIGFVDIRIEDHTELLERLTELAVIVSLFTAGLKLRAPWSDPIWRLPIILAFGAMTVTVALIAMLGVLGLGLSLGAAILLGAILAPTDAVLASEVQVSHPTDRDRLRFTLTAEAGLNDGASFPFAMLGLGLLGLHELGAWGWEWWLVDVLWAIPAGLAIGALLGTIVGRLVIYLRREYRSALGLDDFLTLGLIASSYGVALLAHSYGFLAVFAAGAALRRVERRSGDDEAQEEIEEQLEKPVSSQTVEEIATDPETAPAYLAQRLLGFNEQLERIGEVTIVLLIGTLLTFDDLPSQALWIVPVLFLIIRPIAALLGMVGSGTLRLQQTYIAWFGIRGIGSVYYLMYAIQHGLPRSISSQFIDLTLAVVAVSIVIHGISVTPLMDRYQKTESATTAEPAISP
jgi:NhaP-type Na+/H+ or K+/H+ antiporter